MKSIFFKSEPNAKDSVISNNNISKTKSFGKKFWPIIGSASITLGGTSCNNKSVEDNMTKEELKREEVTKCIAKKNNDDKIIYSNIRNILLDSWDKYNLGTLLQNVPLENDKNSETHIDNFLQTLKEEEVKKLSKPNYTDKEFYDAIDLICKKSAIIQNESHIDSRIERMASIPNNTNILDKLKWDSTKISQKGSKPEDRASIKIMSILTSIYNELQHNLCFAYDDFNKIITTYNDKLGEQFRDKYSLVIENVENDKLPFGNKVIISVSFNEMDVNFENLKLDSSGCKIHQYFDFFDFTHKQIFTKIQLKNNSNEYYNIIRLGEINGNELSVDKSKQRNDFIEQAALKLAQVLRSDKKVEKVEKVEEVEEVEEVEKVENTKNINKVILEKGNKVKCILANGLEMTKKVEAAFYEALRGLTQEELIVEMTKIL